MSGRVHTYLYFDGQAEEALNFYAGVFNTAVEDLMRWGDMPHGEESHLPEDAKNKVMHAQVATLGGHAIMAEDALDPSVDPLFETHTPGNNFAVVLSPETRAEADQLYAALSAGGEQQMPMAEAFWGDYYGQLRDKFGIGWMIVTPAKV